MIQFLEKLDIRLFYLINRGGQNGLLDHLMPFISNERNFYLPIVVGWLFLLIKKDLKYRVVAFAIIGLIVCSDQLCTQVLKPAFSRLRPYDAISDVRLYKGPDTPWQITSARKDKSDGNTKSMPSAHATNVFAAAVFLSYYFRRIWPLMFIIAAAVGYSRIYLGVHYPSDVLAGAATGGLLAWGGIWLTNLILNKLTPKTAVASEQDAIEKKADTE